MRGLDLRLSLRLQLLGLFGLLLIGGTALLLVGEYNQRQVQRTQSELKDRSLAGIRRMMAVADAYGVDVVDSVWKAVHGQMGWAQAEHQIEAATVRIDLHWRELAAGVRTAEQHALFEQLNAARGSADRALARASELIAAGDRTALRAFAEQEMYAAIDPVTTRLRYLSDLEMIDAERHVQQEDTRLAQFRWLRVGIFVAMLGVAAWVGRDILRNLFLGVESLVHLANALRRREFERSPRYRPRGELGEVLDAFLEMRAGLRANEAELRATLEHNEQVRERLQQRELFQRSLLAAAQVAILSVDAEGRYTHVNPFAERLLGYPAEQLVGIAGPDLLHAPEQLRQVASELSTALDRPIAADWRLFLSLAAHRYGAMEWRLRRRDGSTVTVLQAVSAMQSEAGELLGLLFVAADLTELKTLESELRRSEARAQEASRAKSAFVAAVSHEIRTPMVGLCGMVDVLGHTRLDGEQRQALEVIQQAADNLLQIIGDVLDFSKIEADRLELAPQPTDLRRLIEHAALPFQQAARTKGVALNIEIDPQLAPAHQVDPTRLRQILNNLLSNAVKFTARGQIQLQLQVSGGDEQTQRLRLDVSDSGVGISREAQAQLFQPFAQGSTRTAGEFGGSGLGLAICRQLARLMGGEIELQSTAGVGSRFSVQLCLPRADPAALRDWQSAAPPPVAPDRSASVLLVDDHPTNRSVLARQLQLAGFQPQTAADGQAALQRWREGGIDLLLTDLQMPGIDGYELARRVRAEEAERGLPRTPILALSALVLKGEAERCREAGMDDWLAKPLSIDSLQQRLRAWLPAPAELESRCFDPEHLASLCGGDAELQQRSLQDFLASAEQDLQALQQAGQDAEAMARAAHRLHGAAALIGAPALAAAAEQLTRAARSTPPQSCADEIAGVEREWQRLQASLAENTAGL